MAEELITAGVTEVPNETYDFLQDKPETEVTPQAEGTPPVTETTETTEESEFPSFIPEDYKLPKSFKDEKEELETLRKNYKGMQSYLLSEDFAKSISEAYKNNLIESDWSVKELKAIKEALEGNPERAMKIYFPDLLQKQGISPLMSNDEKIDYIHEQLTSKFGKDYRDKWNPNEVIDPKSFSAQVYKLQTDLLKNLEEKENEYKEKNAPLTPERIEQKLKEEYEKKFKDDYSVEEFHEFINDIKEWTPDLVDYNHAKYFDDYIKRAKDEGYKEGVASIKNGLKKAVIPETKRYENVSTEKLIEDPNEFIMDLYRTRKQGVI